MNLRHLLVGMLSILLCSPCALAAPLSVTAADQRDVMVTVYNGNLGLVRDVRETRLPAGLSSVQFMDVAALVDPTSVHLVSLTDRPGLAILEQNYEYDLLSSEKLLEKYVGRTVRLQTSDGLSREARLLTTRGPVFDIDGQIHLGHRGQIVLPALPENLVAQPTLVWLLKNRTDRPQRVEASYLTGGLNWKADYVMVLGPRDDRADVTGWVTVENTSGATYANAALKLVAGDVNRVPESRKLQRAMEVAAATPAAAADRAFVSEGLFEYHLYTLDARTTIKQNQTKQLTLMTAADVPVKKRLFYYGAQEYYRTTYGQPIANQKVAVTLEIVNGKDQRLGVPLPRGKVRVYKADTSGSQQFVGEDWIDHTPKDERVRIKLGNAFDVVGERTQKDWRRVRDNVYEIEWEISLRNHKTEDQTVTVLEPVPGEWQVLSSNHPYEKPEAHTLRYEARVPKGGATTITYRVRTRL
jgi:hypothetical protein